MIETRVSISSSEQIVIDPAQQLTIVTEHIKEMQRIAVSPEASAFNGVAKLLTMCTAEEIYRRTEVEMGSISNFEQTRDGKMFKDLAIKRFERSAADKDVKQPENIRPPIVLYQVISFLRDAIAD